MTASDTYIQCTELKGFGNQYFATKYFMKIVYNANSLGNAPENQVRQVVGYVTDNGVFSVSPAFSANVEANDVFLLIEANQINTLAAQNSTANVFPADVIGNKTDDASNDPTATTKSILAFVKGILGRFSVPATDSTSNTVMSDVIGSKADTALTTEGSQASMMRYVKGILSLCNTGWNLYSQYKAVSGTTSSSSYVTLFDYNGSGKLYELQITSSYSGGAYLRLTIGTNRRKVDNMLSD